MYRALPRLCNHRKEPACLPVCPVKATYQHDNGIVVIDASACIGCGFCVQACPYDARFLNRQTRTADKCTFCAHRLEAGLLPVCVESCVDGARLFGDLNAPDSLIRRTLDAHKDALKVLYPEKGTEPFVFYLHLDDVCCWVTTWRPPCRRACRSRRKAMLSFSEFNIAPPESGASGSRWRFSSDCRGRRLPSWPVRPLWRRASAGAGRLFGVVALASGLAGQACLLMGLEQPLRAYELYLRPHFISWTAWGGFLIPLCLLCTVPLVWPRRKGRVHPLWFLPAIGAACAVFIYADSEIMDCVGRVLWARPLLPMGFILAGLSAAFGFTCLMAPRTDGAFSLPRSGAAAAAFVRTDIWPFARPRVLPNSPHSGGTRLKPSA